MRRHRRSFTSTAAAPGRHRPVRGGQHRQAGHAVRQPADARARRTPASRPVVQDAAPSARAARGRGGRPACELVDAGAQVAEALRELACAPAQSGAAAVQVGRPGKDLLGAVVEGVNLVLSCACLRLRSLTAGRRPPPPREVTDASAQPLERRVVGELRWAAARASSSGGAPHRSSRLGVRQFDRGQREDGVDGVRELLGACGDRADPRRGVRAVAEALQTGGGRPRYRGAGLVARGRPGASSPAPVAAAGAVAEPAAALPPG